jgi:histidinol-phosphate aminotransferase
MSFDPVRPELADLESYVPHVPDGIRVKLDANEAPHPPEGLDAIVREAVGGVDLARYPDPRAPDLKAQIARRTGAKVEELLVGTGSDEVISILMTALSRPRPRTPQPVVMMPTPTFVMYAVTGRAHGWKVMHVPLDDAWDIDPAAFGRAMGVVVPNVIFIATPNNPTGNRMSVERLEKLIDLAGDAVVILDEAYVDYAETTGVDARGASSPPSKGVRGLREGRPRVGILRTLSKVGLAALRIGWLEADAALVREIDKARQPFNVSAIAQAAATAALDRGWDAMQALAAEVRAERARLSLAIRALEGFSVTPSDANFLWVGTPAPAAEVWDGLVRKGVLVRSFHRMGGRLATRLRITIGTRSENDAALEALATWRQP